MLAAPALASPPNFRVDIQIHQGKLYHNLHSSHSPATAIIEVHTNLEQLLVDDNQSNG